MKTTRRHELGTNELADKIGHWAEKLRPYTQLILGLILAVVVLIFAGMYVMQQSHSRASAGWTQYMSLLDEGGAMRVDPGKLRDLARTYEGTPVGDWSRVLLADHQLNLGAQKLFTDKAEAHDLLREAVDNYRTAISNAREPLAIQQAMFGLARAHEDLDELPTARDDYKKLIAQYPDSAFVQAAQQRIDDLAKQETKEFYDWFAKYERPRPMAKEPGTPGKKPAFTTESLGDEPLLKRPTFLNLPEDDKNLPEGDGNLPQGDGDETESTDAAGGDSGAATPEPRSEESEPAAESTPKPE